MTSVTSLVTEGLAMSKPPSIADEYIPDRSYDLIDLLVKTFPARCILPHQTVEEAHRYAGMVDLVQDLEEWKRNEMGLEDHPSDDTGT